MLSVSTSSGSRVDGNTSMLKSDRLYLLLLATCIVSLVVSWDDYRGCEDPLRLWILIDYCLLLCFRAVHLAFVFRHRAAWVFEGSCCSPTRLYLPIKYFFYPGLWGWTILGCIWVSRSHSCISPAQVVLLVLVMALTCIYLIFYGFMIVAASRALQGLRGGAENFAMQLNILTEINDYGVAVAGGLTPAQIASLTKSHITQTQLEDAPGGATCSICLTDVAAGSQVHSFKCRHIFHADCIESWMPFRAECPNCSHPLAEENFGGDAA